MLRVSSVSKLDISGEEGCGDGLDGTGVWVRTCADGEDEEGDGVEHVGHGGRVARGGARGLDAFVEWWWVCATRRRASGVCVLVATRRKKRQGLVSCWQQRAEQERKER